MIKLYDAELKVMKLLWEHGSMTAKEISVHLKKELDWEKTTTYTVIKKCVDKNVIIKKSPNYICEPMVTKEQVQNYETNELISKMFNGDRDQFFASIINENGITKKEADNLRKLLDALSTDD